ncbi:MAG: GNAT family N-acetyltransferase [Planctomycetales bacterium]
MAPIVAAGTRWREPALGLLYGTLPAQERASQMAQMQAAARNGEISLDELLVAIVQEKVAATSLTVHRPGGMAFLWPPVIAPGENPLLADQLLASAASRLESSESLYAQCLLEPQDAEGRELLERGGFPYVTDVLLLSRQVDRLPLDAPRTGLESTPYSPSEHAAYVRVVEATFVETLDCSRLTEVRDAERSLTGHRAAGPFDPALWRLFRIGAAEVGVLLAVDHADSGVREILYLGVVPEARGRGIGKGILQSALRGARRDARQEMQVAVDAANHPARKVYRELGFREDRKMAVHLRLRHTPVRAANGLP